MPTQAEMKAVMSKYVDLVNAADVAGVVALFADGASVEDPVGTPTVTGCVALTEFYTRACANACRLNILSGPHGSFGNSAGMAAEVLVTLPDKGPCRVRLVEIQTFDEQCKITSMRAYWGSEDMQAV